MNYQTTSRFLSRLTTQMLTGSAISLVYLAHAYMATGHGINPFVALPIATLCIVEPYIRSQYLNVR